MIQNIKFCKKCKKAFDIGTNFNLCPKCRNNQIKKEERGNGKRLP